MKLRSVWVASVALFPAAAMAQEAVTWVIDTAQSTVTIEVEATLGASTLSDADNTSITGTISGSLDPFAFPFETIHLTALSAQATSNLSFSLTVPFFGGVNASVQNLTFAVPGLNNTGVAGAPASVDLSGSFNQADNLIETGGLFSYQGVGILGASVGSGSIDLATQPPTPASFAGTITQSPGLLTLNLPLNFTGTQTVNNIPVTITTVGTLVATAPSNATGWKTAGSGTWGDAANWSGGLPGTNEGRRVYLGPVTTGATVVNEITGSVDVLRIKSPHTYSIDNVDRTAAFFAGRVEVVEGEHFYTGRLRSLNTSTTLIIDVSQGAAFVVVGAIDAIDSGNGRVVKRGSGRLTALGTIAQELVLEAGVLQTSGFVDTIDVAPGTVIMLNGMLSLMPSELSEVAALVASGYAGGTWLGSGISADNLVDPNTQGVGYTLRQQLGSTEPDLRLDVDVAYLGDADLSGSVGFADLLVVAQNYEQPGTKYWFEGDFNYDGGVTFPDLLTLAQNYTGGNIVDDWARARSLVPEPTALTVLACTSLVLARRRVL